MKINFKHAILACAALAVGLTGCVKNNGGDIDTTEGAETYAQFNFSFPANTRATDAGITAESAVETVEVFIFKGAQRENYVLLSASDFTPNGNLYTANAYIKTTEGAKKVYVGVNLPAALGASAIVNETQFTSAVKSIPNNELVVYTGSDLTRLAMFSVTPATPTLTAWDGVTGTIPATNKVQIPVQRMVAKAAASEGATLSTTITDYAVFNNLQFKVAGLLKQTYIGRNVVGGVIQSPDYARGDTVNTALYSDAINDYVNVNLQGTSTTASGFNAQYAPENTNAVTPRMGETTRIVVKANVQPAFVWGYATDGAAWGDWSATANTAANTTDFFMVETVGGTQYFFLTETDQPTTVTSITNFMDAYVANQGSGTVSDHFNASRNSAADSPAAYITKYTGGVCYWNKLWLNIDGASNGLGGAGTAANVGQTYRNDFYHMSINNITGIGDGSETIIDPEKPIVNPESYLEVTMEILPWNYYATGVDL